MEMILLNTNDVAILILIAFTSTELQALGSNKEPYIAPLWIYKNDQFWPSYFHNVLTCVMINEDERCLFSYYGQTVSTQTLIVYY